jgi:hypothetical protein
MSTKKTSEDQNDKITLILNKPLHAIVQYGILGISTIIIILFILCFNINIEETVNAKAISCQNAEIISGSECIQLILATPPSDEINIGQLIMIKKSNNIFTAIVVDKSKSQSQEISISANVDHNLYFKENDAVTIIVKTSIGKFLFTSLKF